MKTKIIYADSKGGVKTVSNILHKSFINSSINSELLNMNDYGKNIWQKLKNSYKIIKKYDKNDVLILQHFDVILFGIFLKFFGYKNIINVVHTNLIDYYSSSNIIKKIIVRVLFFIVRNDLIVFVSNEAELKAKKKFNLTNTKTIYNIYNFNKNINHNSKTNEKIVLGTVSRLHSVKNIDLAIRVIKELHTQDNNIELLIYGDGDQKELIYNYIKKLNCSEYIKLMGSENNKEKIYNSIDTLISFSSIEGLPTVILESINFKKPIFYTDCSSGPRELMSPNSNPLEKTKNFEKTDVGYLVKPIQKIRAYELELDKYEEEYVDILKKFVDDVKNNKFSMKYNGDRFSEEIIIDEWKELIGRME